MKNRTGLIRNLAFTWLAGPEETPKRLVSPQQLNLIKVPMPTEVGEASIELMTLNDGTYFSQGRHVFRPEASGQRFASTRLEGEISEPIFVIRATQSGRIIMRDNVAGKDLTYGRDVVAFQHIDQIDILPVLETGEDVLTSTLTVGESKLVSFLGKGPARALLRAFRILRTPAAVTEKLPSHLLDGLHSCASANMHGRLRALFVQGKVMELLCLLADYASDAGPGSKPPAAARVVLQLREELEELHGETPRLDELAERYGMSARSLNESFRRRYGLTISAFVAEKRLDEAYTALKETDVAMKVLADGLGYSHVNNFISAFKRKFGYTPGKLRRGFTEDGEATS